LIQKEQKYFNRTLEDIGKRNIGRAKTLSTSKYWSRNSIPRGTNINANQLMEIEKKKNHQAVLNHRIWKINNRRKKKKKLSDFEMRLELTLQKKKLKQKELERKYYGYNFKPDINKKRINIHKKPKKRIKNTWRRNNQKPAEIKKKKVVRVEKRKIRQRQDSREQEIEYEDSIECESSNEIEEIKYYLKSKKNKPTFKRFSKNKQVFNKSKESESIGENTEEDQDESKLIDMEDEEDIPDQLVNYQPQTMVKH
jgi:hypothetical protein